MVKQRSYEQKNQFFASASRSINCQIAFQVNNTLYDQSPIPSIDMGLWTIPFFPDYKWWYYQHHPDKVAKELNFEYRSCYSQIFSFSLLNQLTIILILLKYSFWILIPKWVNWVFHAFRATPSSTESHSFHHLEPHNPLIRAVSTLSVVRCICRILSSIDLANWRCFFVRDLKRILELMFENFCFSLY